MPAENRSLPDQETRVCVECGVPVRPGDGGVRAFGKLFCSEDCADEQDTSLSRYADVFEDRVDYYGSL